MESWEGKGEGVREWTPDASVERRLALVSVVVLFLAVVLHTLLWAAPRGVTGLVLGLWPAVLAVVVSVVLVMVIVVVHELIHGLVIVLCGGRPTFGAGRSESGAVAFFYTTALGHLFTRTQYAAVALAPLVVLGALLAWWTASGPWAGYVVVPAAVHLAGCVGDVGLTVLAWRQPDGTLIEDRKVGVAFHDTRVG